MKDISIIIVNYNVVHFLEQTLYSVNSAKKSLDIEVFVVDNNSIDESISMVRTKYPGVKLIENNFNLGFSKANNQAIKKSLGKYVLLLNPDTILQEDTLQECFNFMESKPDAGALGVRMIDGSGTFLPESKRGFPTPFVAFTKFTGLSKLFPRSKFWNAYHLLYLDEFETNEVDVLCGAFMFIRKSCLDHVGLLDEDYFMYGEDIDLSYRIVKGGYKNYYFPKTSIIHFKGESTKKGSLNYVKTFYNAMIIFANKHFKGEGADVFVFFLKLAIWGRASLSFSKRILSQLIPPLLEGAVFFTMLKTLAYYWAIYFHNDADYYAQAPLNINFLFYSGVWILSLKLTNLYTFPLKILSVLRTIGISSVLLLAIYGMLGTDFRSSRAILIIGSGLVLLFSLIWRLLWQKWKYGSWFSLSKVKKNLLILSNQSKAYEVSALLELSNINIGSKHILDIHTPEHKYWFEMPFTALKDFIRINKVNELIFSAKDIGMEKIMQIMSIIGPEISYKIAGDKEMSIIGSSSKNNIGELYTFDIKFKIDQRTERQMKRGFDVLTAIVGLLLFPFLLFLFKYPISFMRNCVRVMLGKKTWIGYGLKDPKIMDLPKIRSGIIQIIDIYNNSKLKEEDIHALNLSYAKAYKVQRDMEILLKNWKNLEKKT